MVMTRWLDCFCLKGIKNKLVLAAEPIQVSASLVSAANSAASTGAYIYRNEFFEEPEWTHAYERLRNKKIAVAKLLLEKSANLNAFCKKGMTPLHCAAYHGDVQLVKLFLENKAKVDAVDSSGSTPLHLVVSNDRDEVVKLLKKTGCY